MSTNMVNKDYQYTNVAHKHTHTHRP